jgi:hypothetical protein
MIHRFAAALGVKRGYTAGGRLQAAWIGQHDQILP